MGPTGVVPLRIGGSVSRAGSPHTDMHFLGGDSRLGLNSCFFFQKNAQMLYCSFVRNFGGEKCYLPGTQGLRHIGPSDGSSQIFFSPQRTDGGFRKKSLHAFEEVGPQTDSSSWKQL